jgi:hypothetical protein
MATDKLYDIPGNHYAFFRMPTHLALTATETMVLWIAPVACTVTGVAFAPDAAITGDDTDYTEINILDGGTDGTGTTEIGNLDLVTDVDVAASDMQAITVTATAMAADDTLKVQFALVSSGVLIPPSAWRITFIPS